MGLAAAKASLNVHHYNSSYNSKDIKDVYKDKLFYRLLIHKDCKDLSDDLCKKILEFDQQRKQRQHLAIWRKASRKIVLPTMKRIRFSKLKTKNSGKQRFANFIL